MPNSLTTNCYETCKTVFIILFIEQAAQDEWEIILLLFLTPFCLYFKYIIDLNLCVCKNFLADINFNLITPIKPWFYDHSICYSYYSKVYEIG